MKSFYYFLEQNDPKKASNMIDLCLIAKFAKSKGEAKNLILGGGFYINDIRKTNPYEEIYEEDLLHNKFISLRKGKREYFIIQLKNANDTIPNSKR